MSITSLPFLFLFLPIVLAAYYFLNTVNSRIGEAVLLIASLIFYAIGSPEYVALFFIALMITVFVAREIDKLRDNLLAGNVLLVAGISLNAGLLIYYKYAHLGLSTWGSPAEGTDLFKDIALPLGISFFTFRSISYLVDVYRQKAQLTGDLLHDALYLSFFAQIQMGPLSRYNDMATRTALRFDLDLFSHGVFRFLTGFNKKILIANILSNITTEVFNTPFDDFSTSYAWLGSVCYSLQLLFDFSGYSDMAVGITEMFGYRCPENFDYPYITSSVSGFWRRWHITLSEWFRDYIYIPLGGSRNRNRWRVYLNLFIVWLLTGIWHGAAANFVAWGLGYFAVISFERLTGLPGRLTTKAGKAVYRVITLLFINFQWVLFNSKDLYSGIRYIKWMVCPGMNELTGLRTFFLVRDYWFFILVALILCVPVVPGLDERLKDKKVAHGVYEASVALITVAAFIWAISFVVAGQNNPFVYANF